MKKTVVPYALIFFWLVLATQILPAQSPLNAVAGERIQACTDRTMYISGETVNFSVLVYLDSDTTQLPLSRIFYGELITPAGNRIAAGKFLLKNAAGHGSLVIPEETISGIYFLKIYTRFMRNAGTETYSYTELKIVNPYKSEVLDGKILPDTGNKKSLNHLHEHNSPGYIVQTNKKIYSPRDEVHLEITRKSPENSSGRICLSVVPEWTSSMPAQLDLKLHDPIEKNLYVPETRSVSLSGHLVAKETGKPVFGGRVYLSIIGDKDIQAVTTDTSGSFLFSLPEETGSRDIFLCASAQPGLTTEILINNDFCSKPVFLPSFTFTLDEKERQAAFKLAVNAKVNSMFREVSANGDTTEPASQISFYGEPSEILVMEKYIDLPTIGDYFSELPLMVKVRKTEGRKQFRFWLAQDEMQLYDPLVLVDWVAVDDIEKVLAMSPLEIARIEFVNSLYVKGAITYGGIVSFVSRKNDFAGIDLPKSGTFVNYRFLEESTDKIGRDVVTASKPDSRNTVYWDSDIKTTSIGAETVSFLAPDTPGRYEIRLIGLRASGEVILYHETFVVE